MCSECDFWIAYYKKPENKTIKCATCRAHKTSDHFKVSPRTNKIMRTCDKCSLNFRCDIPNCFYTSAYRVQFDKHCLKDHGS